MPSDICLSRRAKSTKPADRLQSPVCSDNHVPELATPLTARSTSPSGAAMRLYCDYAYGRASSTRRDGDRRGVSQHLGMAEKPAERPTRSAQAAAICASTYRTRSSQAIPVVGDRLNAGAYKEARFSALRAQLRSVRARAAQRSRPRQREIRHRSAGIRSRRTTDKAARLARSGCRRDRRVADSRRLTQRSRRLRSAKAVAKNSKKFRIVVDSLEGRRLYTPHQRGRRAAGDEEVRFYVALDEIKRAA